MNKNVEYRQKLIIKLNDRVFQYDVYQMVNMFMPFCDIQFSNENFEYDISILEGTVKIESSLLKREYTMDSRFKIKEEVKKAVFRYFEELSGKSMPWGTLIGIRPSKRAMNLILEGKDDEYIRKFFKESSFTSSEKANLCIEVAKREMKYMDPQYKNVSIYIGMAFCPTRCLYCSFAANPIKGFKKEIVKEYVQCLCKEIKSVTKYIKERNLKIHTVYFGGGTPTSVDEILFEEVMATIHENFISNKDIKEFTVECGRPDSINKEKLAIMKKYEVSRISINPQTMNDETLKLIGRNHTAKDIIDVFNMARDMKFDDINMDMIIGLPSEKKINVLKTVSFIRDLKPDSFTVHGLSIKRASRLYDNIINDVKYEIANQDELIDMFKLTCELSEQLNMKPYYMYRQKNMVGNMENIGYAYEGKESVYNIEMMEDTESIIAIGADGVTKAVNLSNSEINRFANVKDVKEYIDRIDEMIEKKIKLLNTIYSE